MAKNTQLLRFAKHSKNAIYGIGLHNERQRSNQSYSNKAIKSEFSKQNLTWFDLDVPFKNRIENILKQNGISKDNNGGRKLRKDANLFCEFVIGATDDFFSGWKPGDNLNENQLNYFNDALKFICDLVGKDNVFSAVLHLDETNPHIHICFCPIVMDKKTGKKKLSAHDLCAGGKATLAKWHTDFNNQVGAKYGLSRGALKSQKKYIQKIEEFKAQKEKELDDYLATRYHSKPILKRFTDALSGKTGECITDLENRLVAAQNAFKEQLVENQKMQKQISQLQNENFKQGLELKAKNAQINEFERFKTDICLVLDGNWEIIKQDFAVEAKTKKEKENQSRKNSSLHAERRA